MCRIHQPPLTARSSDPSTRAAESTETETLSSPCSPVAPGRRSGTCCEGQGRPSRSSSYAAIFMICPIACCDGLRLTRRSAQRAGHGAFPGAGMAWDRQVAAGQPGRPGWASRPAARTGPQEPVGPPEQLPHEDLLVVDGPQGRRGPAGGPPGGHGVAPSGLANDHQNYLFDLLGLPRQTRCGRGRAPWPGRYRGPASRAEEPHARAARAGPATS